MRNILASFINALKTSPVKPVDLLEIEYKDADGYNRTKFVAIYPTNITFKNQTYTSNVNIQVGEFSDGLVEFPNVNITFLDLDGQFRDFFSDAPMILNYPDLRGATITLKRVMANALTGGAIISKYRLARWSASSEAVQFECDTHLQNAPRPFPPYVFSRLTCQWIYKDSYTCKYAGNLKTCSKQLAGPNGCIEHKNSKNFGGTPSIADEDIAAQGGQT